MNFFLTNRRVVNKPSLTQVEEPSKETTTAIMPSSAPCKPDFNSNY